MYNGNDGLSSTSKNDPSNLATRNKENYLNPISYLMQIKPQLTQVLLKINFCIICDWEMDLGHLADFFEFVLVSGLQPGGWGQSKQKFKKYAKGTKRKTRDINKILLL